MSAVRLIPDTIEKQSVTHILSQCCCFAIADYCIVFDSQSHCIMSSGITGFLQSLADRPIRVLEIETFFSIMSRRLQLPDPETKSLRRSDEDALPAGSCRRHEAS